MAKHPFQDFPKKNDRKNRNNIHLSESIKEKILCRLIGQIPRTNHRSRLRRSGHHIFKTVVRRRRKRPGRRTRFRDRKNTIRPYVSCFGHTCIRRTRICSTRVCRTCIHILLFTKNKRQSDHKLKKYTEHIAGHEKNYSHGYNLKHRILYGEQITKIEDIHKCIRSKEITSASRRYTIERGIDYILFRYERIRPSAKTVAITGMSSGRIVPKIPITEVDAFAIAVPIV